MIAVRYNGVELSELFVVSNLVRPLPEFRDASSDVDGRDGSVFSELTYGPREVSFDVIYKGETDRSVQDAARALMAALSVREPKALTFSDEMDADKTQLVRYAVPTSSFDMQQFIRAGRWSCRLRQHDPYLYGKRRTVTLMANKTVKVSAGGNAEAYPTAKATVAGGNLYAVRIVGGKSLSYAASFSGQQITVSMGQQTVSVSPSISGADGIRAGSRFFAIEGTMPLKASHDTELTWRERWL